DLIHVTSLHYILIVPRTPTLVPSTTLFRSRAPSFTPFIRNSEPTPSTGTAYEVMLTWESWVRTSRRVSLRSSSVSVRFRRALTKIGRHTSELQSRENLVCRLLLEKKKKESV